MKTPSSIKKVWNIVSTVLVAIVVIMAVLLMGARIVGLNVYNVVSGSMTPVYNVGDLIYVKSVDPATLKAGDDITFILNEDLVVATHRVVSVDTEKQHIYTKGIANKDADKAPVHFKNVIGTPVFKIPVLGYVSNWVQNPPGLYITVFGGAVLLIAVFLPDLIKGKAKKPDEDENEALRKEIEHLRSRIEANEAAEETVTE